MFRDKETQVLIVGAGPVGMFMALCLAERGIRAKIIDKEERTAAHSYACALHSETLKLLDRLGLLTEVLALGRPIETVSFYEGLSRRAELKLSRLDVDFPFVVALPQSALEDLLERHLNQKCGIRVDWSHRLSSLEPQRSEVVAVIDRLCESGKGYSVADLDWEVQRTLSTRAAFVVGADGYDSVVRQSLGLEWERVATPESFAVFEFESDGRFDNEVRIVLEDETTNVFWPLPNSRCRWSLQSTTNNIGDESHAKERTDVLIVQPAVDRQVRNDVQKLIQERAPWFEAKISELDWSTDVQFESRFAKQFGRGRCWLVGDAAHQTGPIGMQSMNVGLCEAEELAGLLARILQENTSLDVLQTYEKNRRNEWQQLLGVRGGLKPRDPVNPWVKEHSPKILPCVPASRSDLAHLVHQLGLDFQIAN